MDFVLWFVYNTIMIDNGLCPMMTINIPQKISHNFIRIQQKYQIFFYIYYSTMALLLPDRMNVLYSFIKSNLMKEAAHQSLSEVPSKTRNRKVISPMRKLHQRGDKVVVNGAKESLLAIMKKYICGCSKHTLDKLAIKFLNKNGITASYDLVVWIFIFIRKIGDSETYSEILKDYLKKMRKKEN